MIMTRRVGWLHVMAIALVACACYANSVWNGYAMDDNFIILGNPRVHQLNDQSQIWLTPYWTAYGKSLGLYRPLAIFGYALQWAAGAGEVVRRVLGPAVDAADRSGGSGIGVALVMNEAM